MTRMRKVLVLGSVAWLLLSPTGPLRAGSAELTGTISPDESSVKSTGPLTFYAGGAERMRVTTAGNVGIGTTNPAAKLDVNGYMKFGCRPGFWSVADGKICVQEWLRAPSTAWNAIATCRAQAPGCRVCTHRDLQQACGSGVTNPYGNATGWYGDHGIASGGNWDDEFHTWNGNGCADNNDGLALHAGDGATLMFRCCY